MPNPAPRAARAAQHGEDQFADGFDAEGWGGGECAVTTPIWIASPPEVHSALLSSGPGPGVLLAAAGAWQALGAEYARAAADLLSVLAAAQSSWQGPSAAQYVAAHAPYLGWLTQAQANSQAAAAQHEAAAAAYTTALALMPTLPELAANHVVHGVLVATNFFGINTIPIALNEADYVRMWLQAAAAMTGYEAASAAATAAVPPTAPAPAVLKSNAVAEPSQLAAAAPAADSGNQLNLADLITQLLQQYVQYVQQLYEPITNFLQNPVGNTFQLINDFMTNPAQALVTWGPFLFAVVYQIVTWIAASLTYPQLLLDPLLSITLGVVIGVGYEYLQQLPPVVAEGAEAPVALAGAPQHSSTWPLATLAPTVAGPAGAPATSATGTPGSAPASAAPASAAPAVPYAVIGVDPGEGFTPTFREGTKAKAPAEGIPAAAAGVAARDKRRSRRRRSAIMPEHQYADEVLDYDPLPDPSAPDEPAATASSSSAGPMGFGGTASRGDADAAGLMTLSDDEFGGGPTVPMLPTTWEAAGR